ncbi:transposable element Tcb2 transposase [Trichonephila clavipes]|nr:transposable element Tcb2 transposase [Trichonephila clavipes]
MCNTRFTVWVSAAIVQCSSSGCTSCLGKRVQRLWSLEARKRVAWSYESRFQILNPDGRLRIRRQAPEPMDPACQFCYPHGNGVFQQDNCTCHKSRLATGWLDEYSSDFSVRNWPARSQDLNTIEHLWDVLEQGLKGHHTAPTNLTELWTPLANIWQAEVGGQRGRQWKCVLLSYEQAHGTSVSIIQELLLTVYREDVMFR